MNNSSKKKIETRGVGLAGPEWSEGERSEPEGHGGPARPADTKDDQHHDPEVSEKVEKRRFTVAYKARIVREADACTESGQIGALLRREGLYSSQLSKWRQAYRKGALAALRDDKRGRKQTRHPLETENEKLKKTNVRLEKRLNRAEAIIDIQKKLSGLLGIPLESEDSEGND